MLSKNQRGGKKVGGMKEEIYSREIEIHEIQKNYPINAGGSFQ